MNKFFVISFLISFCILPLAQSAPKKGLPELYRHIQDSCSLVDREMAMTVSPGFVDKVFYSCELGRAIEVFKGCSVPCANETWTLEPKAVKKSPDSQKTGN